jgi:signal transduction histidine kinase
VRVWSECIEIENEPCDLAFTLNVTEEKRQQEMWRNVVKGESGQTGEAFFCSLVEQLTSALGASSVAVGNIEEAGCLSAVVLRQEKLHDPAHAIEVQIEPGLVAHCDARLTQIVLENLLGNAWKYSAKAVQPRIEFVGLPRTVDGLPRFAVRDNGAGFEMARADRLFKPFSRLHPPTEFQGSGIGLATVRRIIERHGGQISGEGQVGRGASFQFHFGHPGHD